MSCNWQHYQAAAAFCILPDGPQYTPGGHGGTTTGSDPACKLSGFRPGDIGLYKVQISAPPLCAFCRRYFIDLSKAKPDVRGHAFYAIASVNDSYTIDPVAHSPNTKNFTNDHLLATPPGTVVQLLMGKIDLYLKAYVTDSLHFVHNDLQGPYYAGPWYVNSAGQRIQGVYVDVNIAVPVVLGNPKLDALRYLAGYDNGLLPCPDELNPALSDADFLYAGCVDHVAASSTAYDPLNKHAQ